MIKEYISFAYHGLKHRKLRSFLTIIGIVIGIASIVALIAISEGLGNAITEQFNQMGTNRIFIYPKGLMTSGDFQSGALTEEDIKVVESVAEVDWTNPMTYDSGEVKFGKETGFAQQIIGIKTEDVETKYSTFGVEARDGRFLNDNEKGSVMIGPILADSFFDKKIYVNNKITINGENFKVVGIFTPVGNPTDDTQILMPVEDAKRLFNKPDEYAMVDVKLKEGVDINQVAEKMKRRLEKSRDNDNFELYTPEQLLSQLETILGIVQVVLTGIAAISLLVGAIGITNSMYTSVLERTRDIGIMKSIGAKNRDIMLIFLIEGGMVGLVGGITGAIVGSAGAYAVGIIATQLGYKILSIQIHWWLFTLGIFFAFIVGALAALFPAKNAMNMKIVDALRY